MSSRIYRGGANLGGTGKPALSADRFIPSNLPFFGTIKVDTQTVDILIQVASYRFVKGGLVPGAGSIRRKHRADQRA